MKRCIVFMVLFLTAAAGFVSYRTRRVPFWIVQTILVVLVLLYFASLYGLLTALGP